MRNPNKLAAVFFVVLLCLSACGTTIGKFRYVVVDRDLPDRSAAYSKAQKFSPKTKVVTGRSCHHRILAMPLGSGNATIDEAYTAALGLTPETPNKANALANVYVEKSYVVVPLFYFRKCY